MGETFELYGLVALVIVTMIWPSFTYQLEALLAKLAERFPRTKSVIKRIEISIFKIPHQPIPEDREQWQRSSF